MKISSLKINGFRSFGPSNINIPINEHLVGFVGLNSSGKTTTLEALRKLFGQSLADRELTRKDFHIGKDENVDKIIERQLSIEAVIDFSSVEKDSVPHFFNNMVVDDEGKAPYIRIRLEATWKKSDLIPEGEI